MTDALVTLTHAELLALALEASRRDDSAQALACLKASASRADAPALALFMLGSEYAQLGLVDQAKAAFGQAVERGPDLPLARFQLGMLHMTCGEVDAARAVWAPLALLEASHPQAYLACFHRGMCHLAADEFAQAAQALGEGVALNQDNPPLNNDMRRVIDAIQHLPNHPGMLAAPAQGSQDPQAPQEGTSAAEAPAHLFISAYANGKLH